MDSQTIRVLIVDDHCMVRQGIKILLEQFEGIHVIGEAANGLQAIDLVEQLEPDVILMDLTMPVMDGIEATKKITARQPDQRVVILTGLLDDENLFQAIQAGAQGCIEKTIEPEDLVQSIRDVCSGKPSLSAGIAWRILRGMTDTGTPGQPKNKLSERELQILRMLTQGKLDHEIASELVLTEVTIRTHISRILSKLNLENRVQAALYGLRTGLVSIAETADVFNVHSR
jgi:DNA-binding NarL/FixJ family response regulator